MNGPKGGSTHERPGYGWHLSGRGRHSLGHPGGAEGGLHHPRYLRALCGPWPRQGDGPATIASALDLFPAGLVWGRGQNLVRILDKRFGLGHQCGWQALELITRLRPDYVRGDGAVRRRQYRDRV